VIEIDTRLTLGAIAVHRARHFNVITWSDVINRSFLHVPRAFLTVDFGGIPAGELENPVTLPTLIIYGLATALIRYGAVTVFDLPSE
jgi:hypothetical protein